MVRLVMSHAAALFLAVTLLTACGTATGPMPSPTGAGQPSTRTPTPTSACPSSGSITVSMATRQPSDILLELAWEGGFTRVELAHAFGRVPDFSLLPDDSVFYLDPSGWDEAQVMVTHLTPPEAQALGERVLELGFERLESYTDQCQPQAGGTCLCVVDAAQSVLRLRLPDGELRMVTNYHEFANDPGVLLAIRALLQDYRHPQAEPYQPDKAALFVRLVSPSPDLRILDWPLHSSLLSGSAADMPCVRVLSGSDLQALLAVTQRNLGDFYFRAGEHVYNVYLVPWLPGVDYTDLIADSGQTCPSSRE